MSEVIVNLLPVTEAEKLEFEAIAPTPSTSMPDAGVSLRRISPVPLSCSAGPVPRRSPAVKI
jgi:hypothetical protein